jgi:hypothetical protein
MYSSKHDTMEGSHDHDLITQLRSAHNGKSDFAYFHRLLRQCRPTGNTDEI